jgi:hypothetical protein
MARRSRFGGLPRSSLFKFGKAPPARLRLTR